MTKYQARDLADKITESEMTEMFDNAKVGIKDWTKISHINKSITIGTAWNILYTAFKEGEFKLTSELAKRNMIFEFQEFLPEHLIPAKKAKLNRSIDIIHQEPKFNL